MDADESDDQRRARVTEPPRTFPGPPGAPAGPPGGPPELTRRPTGPAAHGERVSASFLLAVWDRTIDWEAGRFDLMEALNVWPPSHRQPFLEWAADPWLP